MRLAGKRALLFGAATGIGRAVAQDFAREGASVVIADLNSSTAEETVEGIRASGGKASALFCDVRDEASVADVTNSAANALGGLDTMVFLAGLQRTGAVDAMDVAVWDALFEVNARGMFLAVKHAAGPLRRAGGGAIITTSSLAGLRGAPGMTAYAAAKGAVNGFTVAVAQELAPDNIRVNSVLPGWIDTPFNRPAIDLMGGDGSHADVVRRIVPLGRQGLPDEVSPIYVFLASEEARYITAKLMMVDGGMAH